MLLNNLKEWRHRNSYTQESLSMALGVSRQTIVAWENSEDALSPLVQLALLALEHLPEKCVVVAGNRLSAAQQREARRKICG